MFNTSKLSKETINDLEMLELTKNKLYQHIINALKLASEFIAERNLIVTGGMALDYMLRLQGFQIYDTNTVKGSIPDYDVYSSNHVKDSYDFVDRLHSLGYSNGGKYTLDSIRGIHVQTMRVRLEFISILELTYIPQDIFDIMPTLKYEKLRIIHPNWQRINMHRSLAYPLIDPPREVMFNRLSKDTERFSILNRYYPILPKIELYDMHILKTVPLLSIITRDKISINVESDTKLSKLNTLKRFKGDRNRMSYISVTYDVIQHLEHDNALYGFTAYAAINLAYKRIMAKHSSYSADKDPLSKYIINAEFNLTAEDLITFTSPLPLIEYLTASKTTIESMDAMDEWILYEPILEYLPPKYRRIIADESIDIYCLLNTYINVHKMQVGQYKITVPCINVLFTYFLTQYNITKKDIYLTYYKSLESMLHNVNDYVAHLFEKDDFDITTIKLGTQYTKNVAKAINIILDSPFFISKHYYGVNNRSESYIINDINDINMIRRVQGKSEMQTPIVPSNKYNPEKGLKPGLFDYSTATYFKMSGKPVE